MSTNGKVIVIEGLDGAGKETQASRIFDTIRDYYKANDKNTPISLTHFPLYKYPSAYFVESYLQGEYGTDPYSIDPYTASTFYAMDRFDEWARPKYGHVNIPVNWSSIYREGGLVICDRYVLSNIIHQGSKIYKKDGVAAAMRFAEWVEDLEYKHNGIPKPDVTVFLDTTSPYVNAVNMQTRDGTDIHEKNIEYQQTCEIWALEYIKLLQSNKIKVIQVVDGKGQMLPREVITKKIFDSIKGYL